jgi:hypothetical protein
MTGVFTVGEGEIYEAPEMMDHHAQMRLKGNLQQIDYGIFAANREVFQKKIPELDQATMIRFAVVVSEERAAFVAQGLALARAGHTPSDADIAELARLRQRYEEMEAAFRAARRLIERGYAKVPPVKLK